MSLLSQAEKDGYAMLSKHGVLINSGYGKYKPASANRIGDPFVYCTTIKRLIGRGMARRDHADPDRVIDAWRNIGM